MPAQTKTVSIQGIWKNSFMEEKVYKLGLIGYPLGHSLSPVLYKAAFEGLGLNRLYGSSIIGNRQSNIAGELFLFTIEGILRQSVIKEGCFYDVRLTSMLKDEYFNNKEKGDYEFKAILQRLRKLRKQNNN